MGKTSPFYGMNEDKAVIADLHYQSYLLIFVHFMYKHVLCNFVRATASFRNVFITSTFLYVYVINTGPKQELHLIIFFIIYFQNKKSEHYFKG